MISLTKQAELKTTTSPRPSNYSLSCSCTFIIASTTLAHSSFHPLNKLRTPANFWQHSPHTFSSSAKVLYDARANSALPQIPYCQHSQPRARLFTWICCEPDIQSPTAPTPRSLVGRWYTPTLRLTSSHPADLFPPSRPLLLSPRASCNLSHYVSMTLHRRHTFQYGERDIPPHSSLGTYGSHSQEGRPRLDWYPSVPPAGGQRRGQHAASWAPVELSTQV